MGRDPLLGFLLADEANPLPASLVKVNADVFWSLKVKLCKAVENNYY